MSSLTPSLSTSTSTIRSGSASPKRRRAPSSPSSRASAAKQRARQQHGIAAPAGVDRRRGERERTRREGVDQAIERRRLDSRHVAEQDERARGVGGQSRDAGMQRGGEAAGEVGVMGEGTGKPASAASTASRAWPVTTTTGRAREASAASATWRTSGLPSSDATSFETSSPPSARKRAERPAASTSAAISAIAEARLRARSDFHQQAADAHRLDVGADDRHAGENALQHPVEAVLLGRARAARGAEDRQAAARGRAAADCPDRPACRNARSARRSPRSRRE